MKPVTRRIACRSWLLLLALALLAMPAAAETFTVELTNGTSFVTRYQPQEAGWDANLVLLMTEHGNWIAVPRQDIVNVKSSTESEGFGRLINTTTIDLGWAPNDNPLPETEQAQTPLDVLQNLLQQERPVYDQHQFVSPSEAGGGLPLGYATGLGGGGAALVPFGGDFGGGAGGGAAGGSAAPGGGAPVTTGGGGVQQ